MGIYPTAQKYSPRMPRTLWCIDCDRELTYQEDVGPIHHITDNPDHRVIDCVGEFSIWRETGHGTN